jgi:hypothetical protein
MTVIAYRDGIMAADSACWDGNVIYSVARKKIVRLKDGSLFAGTGSTSVIEAARAWLNGEADRPAAVSENDFSALIVRPNGAVFGIEHNMLLFEQPPAPYHYLGPDFVAGALAAGASAAEAVRLTIQGTNLAAGEVQTEAL